MDQKEGFLFFNASVNHCCVKKKNKNIFKLAFSFHAFPEIPEMLAQPRN